MPFCNMESFEKDHIDKVIQFKCAHQSNSTDALSRVWANGFMYTETKMSSFWWNFHHWLHWKLSFWQLSVQPAMKISSKWRHFRFSVAQIGFWQAVHNMKATELDPLGQNHSTKFMLFNFERKKFILLLFNHYISIHSWKQISLSVNGWLQSTVLW